MFLSRTKTSSSRTFWSSRKTVKKRIYSCSLRTLCAWLQLALRVSWPFQSCLSKIFTGMTFNFAWSKITSWSIDIANSYHLRLKWISNLWCRKLRTTGAVRAAKKAKEISICKHSPRVVALDNFPKGKVIKAPSNLHYQMNLEVHRISTICNRSKWSTAPYSVPKKSISYMTPTK